MSDITLINDSEQSSLVTNGLAKNGELYLKKAGSTDAGSIVVYDSGVWKTFANEGGAYSNGYSLSLDGTDDYASFSAQTFADGARTFSAWFKPSSIVSGYKGIIGGDSHYIGVDLNSKYFLIWDGSTSRYKLYTGTIDTSSWLHVMVVDNNSGSSGNCVIYVNGTNLGVPAPSANTTNPGSLTFRYIGRKSADYFPGLIDEVAIWNSDESANISQIRDTSGSNPVPGDLSLMTNQPLHWWRMGDNDSGSTITDQGSAGVDATLQNQASFSTTVPS